MIRYIIFGIALLITSNIVGTLLNPCNTLIADSRCFGQGCPICNLVKVGATCIDVCVDYEKNSVVCEYKAELFKDAKEEGKG